MTSIENQDAVTAADINGSAPAEVAVNAEAVPVISSVGSEAGAAGAGGDDELDDLADVEFMLEEIEDKIAPLAL